MSGATGGSHAVPGVGGPGAGPTDLRGGIPGWITQITDAADPAAAAEAFWAQGQGTPVSGEAREVEGRECHLVTFVWQQADPARQVLVHLNGITDAHREDLSPVLLEHVAGTDLWHRSLWLPSDGTWGYRMVDLPEIAPDVGATRQGWMAIHRAGRRDPGNPRWLPHMLGDESSVLVMPQAWQHPAWLDAPTASEAWTTWQLVDPSGETRQLRHWAPAQGRASRLLVLFDGEQWAAMGLADAVVRAGLDLELLLIDSIDPGKRARDLPDPARATALVEAALLHHAQECGSRDAVEVIVAGQSYGGLAAGSVVVTRPDLAARAIVQSGSFWYAEGDEPRRDNPIPGDLVRRITAGEFGRLTGRFTIQAGTDEGTMVDQARHFHAAVTGAGAHADVKVVTGGHDFAWWRHHLLRELS